MSGVGEERMKGGRERKSGGEGKARGRSRTLGAISIRTGENE